MSDTTRLRACGLALLIAPGLTLAGHLVQATPSAHDTASELASIAAAPGRASLSAVLGFLALELFVPGFWALSRPLRESRPRLQLTGLVMSVAGVLGLTALMGSAPVTVAMAGVGNRAAMVAVTDHYESSALVGIWVALMLLGYTLGPVVLGIGLWRDGWSWLVPAALVAGVVLMVADAGRWPLAAGFACTWLGLGLVGLRLFVTPQVTTGQRTRPLGRTDVVAQASGGA